MTNNSLYKYMYMCALNIRTGVVSAYLKRIFFVVSL